MIRPEIKILYKYCRYNEKDEDGINRTLKILQEKQIWYSSLSKFNDPFEGIIDINEKFSSYFLIGKAVDHYLKEGHNIETVIKEIKTEFLDEDKMKKKILSARDIFNDENNKFGVLSLSEDPMSILMWTHYANGHSGLCIGFERKEDMPLGKDEVCLPVTYSDIFPEPTINDLLKEDGTATNLSIRTKASEWRYEREWRLMHTQAGLYEIPGPIKEIILGCRWEESKTDEVLMAAKYLKATVYRASIVKGEYRIKREKVTD